MELSDGVKTLKKMMKRFYKPESFRKGLSMKAGPDDVVVGTSPKSGTTWLLQILHTLRSGGDMSFDELFLEVPLIEGAEEYGYGDINKPHKFSPRMFCTHMDFPHVPKGAGKYVFCMRDPHDTAVSVYYYLCGWLFTPEEVSLNEYLEFFWLAQVENSSGVSWPSQFQHIVSWYEHRLDRNVLWLHYEDLKEDLPGVIKKIAQFLDIGADNKELLELVEKHASIDFMKKHHSKFDSHMIKEMRNVVLDLPEGAGLKDHCGRVREGKTGGGKKELSPHVIELINEQWRKIVEPVTGCKSYTELRNKITQELKAREQVS